MADPSSPVPPVDADTGTVNLFTPEHAACPQPTYREMLGKCPVAHGTLGGGSVITRYEDVMWALRHPEIFSSEMEMQVALGTERPMIPQQIDPPRQTRFRKLLDPQFSRKKMSLIEPDVRAHAVELIDSLVDRGECDFDPDFAVPLPCAAFLSLMGLPQSDLPLFLELKDGIIRAHTQIEGEPTLERMAEHRVGVGRQIYAYFEDAIDRREKQPGQDMLSYLLQAELDGEKLSRNDILDVSFLLILAGLDTVTATLGCNVAYLAANPEQRQRIVADPSLIAGSIEELLRWESPVTAVPRVVKRDVTIGDVEVKEGELVSLLIGAANIDDAEFDDPERVDFSRERNRHIAFGAGAHRCLGSHLARMELQVAMEEWHRRIPDYAIKSGETPRYSPGIREVMYLPLVWQPHSA